MAVMAKPCEHCDGTGEIEGQTCPYCLGSAEQPLESHAHDQTEFTVKYALTKIVDLEDKVNDVIDKLNDIWEKLNE